MALLGKRSGNTPSEVQRNNGVRLFLSGRDLLDIDIAATRIHLWKKFKVNRPGFRRHLFAFTHQVPAKQNPGTTALI
jgi:hypothetical protein